MSTSAESLSGTQEPLPFPSPDGLPPSIANDAESLAAVQRGIDRANEIFAHPETQQLPLPTTTAEVRPVKRQVPGHIQELTARLHNQAPNATVPRPLTQREQINKAQVDRMSEGIQ